MAEGSLTTVGEGGEEGSPTTTTPIVDRKLGRVPIEKTDSYKLLSPDEQKLVVQQKDIIKKRIIGKGAFGTVNLAELHGCEVAVKRLSNSFSKENKQDAIQEARILDKLSAHPKVCRFVP
eukprot:UN04891